MMTIKNIQRTLTASFLLLASVPVGINAQQQGERVLPPMGYYINAGLLGDVGIQGYETSVTDRNPRLGYQMEIGSRNFAMPVSYSRGQGIDMIGIKPRVQYLMPFGSGLFSAGGGFGAVYNYWTTDLTVDTTDAKVTVHEFGVQPSLKVLIRPLANLHVLVTPVAVDLNFWRQIRGNSGLKNVGNFSTTNKSFGMVYTGGASVGLNF